MHQLRLRDSGRAIFGKLAGFFAGRFRHDQSGAVAVEFGIVAVPFFTLVFAIMQIALLYISDQLLETAVADAARMIRTGQAAAAGWGVTNFNTQVCNELYVLMDCTKLETYVQTATSFSAISLTPPVDASGNYTQSPSYASGANTASQIVIATTYYEYPTIFSSLGLSLADEPNGTRLLGAVAAFRNEPFP